MGLILRRKCILLLFAIFQGAIFCSPATVLSRDAAAKDGSLSLNEQWTGDYGQMVEDRIIRFLIPFSRTDFYLDGATKRGISYDTVIRFEKYINDQLKTGHLKVHAVIIPTERSRLFERVAEGYGDIAVGNVTITDERKKKVDFSDPFLENVAEVVVSRKDLADLQSSAELSGREVYVKKSSSYYEHLLKLNEKLTAAGKQPVNISLADEHLEDEDLLEMLDAGAVPLLIVDDHKAAFWSGILENIKIHPAASVHSGGEIAWAFRKNSSQLQKIVNAFVKKNKKGTLLGNITFKKYLQNTSHIKNPGSGDGSRRLREMVQFFKC